MNHSLIAVAVAVIQLGEGGKRLRVRSQKIYMQAASNGGNCFALLSENNVTARRMHQDLSSRTFFLLAFIKSAAVSQNQKIHRKKIDDLEFYFIQFCCPWTMIMDGPDQALPPYYPVHELCRPATPNNTRFKVGSDSLAAADRCRENQSAIVEIGKFFLEALTMTSSVV